MDFFVADTMQLHLIKCRYNFRFPDVPPCRRFIYHHHIIIFIKNIKIDLLRQQHPFLPGSCHCTQLSHQGLLFYNSALQCFYSPYHSRIYRLLYFISRSPFYPSHQIFIDAQGSCPLSILITKSFKQFITAILLFLFYLVFF